MQCDDVEIVGITALVMSRFQRSDCDIAHFPGAARLATLGRLPLAITCRAFSACSPTRDAFQELRVSLRLRRLPLAVTFGAFGALNPGNGRWI